MMILNTSSDSLRRRATTYLIRLQSQSRLDAWTRDGNPTWTESDKNILTHCWWIFGDKQNWDGLSISFLHLLVELVLCLPPFSFLSFSFIFFSFFWDVVWKEWYICFFFREETKTLTLVFVELLTGFKVAEVSKPNNHVKLTFDCEEQKKPAILTSSFTTAAKWYACVQSCDQRF